jgi:hypothetical protein
LRDYLSRGLNCFVVIVSVRRNAWMDANALLLYVRVLLVKKLITVFSGWSSIYTFASVAS